MSDPARRKSLPGLLMTLLRSNPQESKSFSTWFILCSCPSFLLFPMLSPKSWFICNNCVPVSSWPVLSFLLFSVTYNYIGTVSKQIKLDQLVSLTMCSTDRSMDITANSLSCFCWVVECLFLTDTPFGSFPVRRIEVLLHLGTVCRSWHVQSGQSPTSQKNL